MSSWAKIPNILILSNILDKMSAVLSSIFDKMFIFAIHY